MRTNRVSDRFTDMTENGIRSKPKNRFCPTRFSSRQELVHSVLTNNLVGAKNGVKVPVRVIRDFKAG